MLQNQGGFEPNEVEVEEYFEGRVTESDRALTETDMVAKYDLEGAMNASDKEETVKFGHSTVSQSR